MYIPLRRMIRFLGWVLVVVSAILLIAFVVSFVITRRFVDSATRAEGTIVKLIEARDSDSGPMYRPVFTFRDSNEVEHEVQSSVGSNPPAFKVGDQVKVLYTKERPENATLDSFMSVWFFPLVIGICGATHLVIGLVFLGLAKWVKAPQNTAGLV
jgi:hypothetical protein